MKHSKAPWRWSDEFTNGHNEPTWSLIADDGYGILSCDMPNAPQNCNGNDAILIAEAPAMLAALIAYYTCLPTQEVGALIERATGEPIEQVLKGESE